MPRRRPQPRRSRPLPPAFAGRRVETGPDGYEYEVRPIAGARAVKLYRCPGCDHQIALGTPHLVVWPADGGDAAADDRRHWHSPCWARRGTRGPTRKWS
ncbi:hypothetical protein ACN27E_25665 [Mycobacterium sp. WMMD1722]|uniref:hypothetical protein n=1 Tax=Mycobacterium sp. WMMD1722 TaxID=3404117 RepID=UPI003BF4E8C7